MPIVIIEAIAYGTPMVVRGGAVAKVVAAGMTDLAACRWSAARNFGVGPFGSGAERINQDVIREVARQSYDDTESLKSVEPQRDRVDTVDGRGRP